MRTSWSHCLVGWSLIFSATAVAAKPVTYEKDVRPILKAHCFQCHGESKENKGGLDLRLRRFILRGGDSGAAIVPGKPGASLLLERIRSGEMPPKDKRLSKTETSTIERWIRQGAKTRRVEPKKLTSEYLTEEERSFWAFQPIRRPRVPASSSRHELRSAIDHFVARRLQEKGLDFSRLATRRVVLRRLCFDLLGLPPTPAQIRDFLTDKSPAAYDRLLDRLLSSPRYGERWGRHWLDVAGYADSEGYVDKDPERQSAYRYRDYVIHSFNADLPFDQFIREQLAGDETVSQPHKNLSAEQVRRLTATGFLRMAPDGTASGGVDRAVASNQMIADTIRITSTALLGLTVGCARCHNHRYDPISQQDYYRLRAIFAPAMDWKKWRSPSTRRVSLYTLADRKEKARIEKLAQQANSKRSKIQAAHIQRTLYEELIKAPDALKATLRKAYLTPGNKRTPQQVALLKEYPNIRNISNGSLYLYAEQRARRAGEIVAVANKKEQEFIARVRATALAKVPKGSRDLVDRALAVASDKRNSLQLGILARFPGLTVDAKTLKKFDSAGAALVAEYRRAAQKCRTTNAKKELADLAKDVQRIRGTIPKEHFIRALTEPQNHVPKTFLFRRGDHRQPAPTALQPQPLRVLVESSPAIPSNNQSLKTTGRRLAYARYLTSGKHPLLARVIVNRIWLHHFGRGIVNTPGDFGQLGARPTHPKLLDWLADEFVRSGWQVKRLHRLILSSHTFRQISARTARLDEVDPDNQLYARQSVRRLETEALRDAVLQVSGMYVGKMFGEPIPVREDAVGKIVLGREKLDGERKPQKSSGLGSEEHRRSIYIQVRRSRPLAVLESFDLATNAPNCTKRNYSNVAPQSLFLMNSDFMVRYSKDFAKRIAHEAGSNLAEQIRLAWNLAYGETPSPATQVALTKFVQRQMQASMKRLKNNKALARQHTMAVLCQGLLAANQFIYID